MDGDPMATIYDGISHPLPLVLSNEVPSTILKKARREVAIQAYVEGKRSVIRF